MIQFAEVQIVEKGMAPLHIVSNERFYFTEVSEFKRFLEICAEKGWSVLQRGTALSAETSDSAVIRCMEVEARSV